MKSVTSRTLRLSVLLTLLGCSTLKSPNRNISSKKESHLNFIFTSHSMLPVAEKELESILESLDPNSVFVEISPEDLRSNKIEGYPLEMIFALKWGQRNSKSVFGFDCSIETKSEKIDEETRKNLISQYLDYRKGRSWRDLNDPRVARNGISMTLATHDPDKLSQRRSCMKQNILRTLPSGKTLVLTGGFHSEYFRGEFGNANFPLTPEQ